MEGDARKLALKIQGVEFAVDRVVQDGVDVAEDRVLGDRTLGSRPVRSVVVAELVQRPVGDVVDLLVPNEAVSRRLLVRVDGCTKVQVSRAIHCKYTVIGT